MAAHYDRFVGPSERLLFGAGGRWVRGQAGGNVLEIAVGTGRNFPYYPEDARLTGVDGSPTMLAVAERRAAELGRAVELGAGDVQALDLPDAWFDAVVSTLALCSIPVDRRAVAEVWQVIRAGGRFLLLEHVRSPFLPVRAAQRFLDPIFVRVAADHLLCEPLDHLAGAGFVVDRLERSKSGIVERVAARKPATMRRPRSSDGPRAMPAPPASREADPFEIRKAMATDPGRSIQMDPERITGTTEHDGETVYYCSLGCKQKFDREPSGASARARGDHHGA